MIVLPKKKTEEEIEECIKHSILMCAYHHKLPCSYDDDSTLLQDSLLEYDKRLVAFATDVVRFHRVWTESCNW